MADLLSLSLDLQILLVSGYFAYKTAVIGKLQTDTKEELFLKIVAFGVIGRLLTYALQGLWTLQGFHWGLSGNAAVVAYSALVIINAMLSAMFWRAIGSEWYSKAMEHFEIYRDDHEPSTWNSITGARALWDCVQIHLEDGKVLESHFNKLDKEVPLPGIRLHEDGVSVYLSAIYRPDGTSEQFTQGDNSGFETITYIPRSQIRQMDVSWKVRQLRR
ncbi:hypothetical protein X766_12575 [Mesorhizobium sp. LSJC255A00]|uniref:hypothetical protein n=1 Tax=Mesorhizobium sp. LSJC255A00 TaxID=1287313 RepID=UPI0003CE7267|nr:hypothetical protein [Mesorhizobium sp. LSJC255A00]ESX19105.1 hypothetical protein X766_12575 [Mesorhizobium sp. LSJC255A00]